MRGEAANGKIMENDANDDKLRDFLKDKKSFYIVPDKNQERVEQTGHFLCSLNPSLEACENREQADVVFQLCDYVMHMTKGETEAIYIDSENNVILDDEDWKCVENYSYSRSLFIYMNQAPFLDAVQSLRKK